MHMIFILCMSTYLSVYHVTCARAAFVNPDEYGIILDAGSSGTKLKIYKWNRGFRSRRSSDTNDVTLHHDLKLVHNVRFTPGVNTLASALDEVPGYMSPILRKAKGLVPSAKHASTSIHFMATAGLRILPINVTEGLLDALRRHLYDVEYNPFYVPRGSVRVISGEEEGVFAWVAANYLKGFFWSDSPGSDAVGVLEMGGGSTQIAFLPDHSVYANMFPVSVGGTLYRLYAHSYLFYGQNYITDRINDHLLKQSPGVSNIYNPCLLSGDNTTRSTLDYAVHIIGSANTTKCLEIIQEFLQAVDDTWCYPKPCAIGSVYQPPVGDIEFYALAAFTYAPTYLKAVDEYGGLNITLLRENAEIYCRKPLQEVVLGGVPSSYASSYCIMGLYIPSLLLDAYGFSTYRNVVYLRPKVGDVTIDWTMGAMLLYVDSIVSTKECDAAISSSATSSLPHETTLSIVLLTSVTYLL